MPDMQSVRTGQGASIVEPPSAHNEATNEGEGGPDTLPEATGPELAGIDEDLAEILHNFEKNKDALSKLLSEGEKLKAQDFIVFKDKADDVVGYELDKFIEFLSQKYSVKKTKHSLNWQQLMEALQEWAAFQTEDRKRERVEDWMDQNEDMDNLDDFGLPEDDGLDNERYHQREKSKDLLTMKLQNYNDQIRDIFTASKDVQNSDEESDEESAHLPPQVRVSKLGKVLKDMGLLAGIVFCTWEDYISGKIDEKKTSKEIVERIKKIMWKDTHEAVCIKTAEQKGKKPGMSILKSGGGQTNAGASEKDPNGPIIEQNNEVTSQHSKTSHKDDKSQSGENEQTEQNPTEKAETEKENEGEGDSNASPSKRPDTTKSDSDKSATSKAGKTTQNGEQPEGAPKAEGDAPGPSDYEISGRAVLFEEEAYLAENRKHYIDVITFTNLIKQFFEENEDMVVLDHMHEYDEEIAEAFRAATEVNYDPFKEKLKKTLEQYENTLIKGDFKDEKEKEVTENLVQDLRNQIARINQARSNTTETDRQSKKQPLTLEELRKRGLHELFSFYAKQHLPEGLEFGDILKKQEVIDLGEFCIFARDFDIKLAKKKMIEIFKKTSDFRHQPLNFKQFCEVIDKIGVAINQERIRGLKKRLKEIQKVEAEKESKTQKTEKTSKEDEKSEKSDKSGSEAEGEDDKSYTGSKDEETETKKEDTETKQEDTETKKEADDSGSDNDSEDSKSKVTKTNAVSETESKSPTAHKSVKFGDDEETSQKKEESDSESEEETDPVKIEKKRLEKELEKYQNYKFEDCHDEIMNYLEVHDQAKYRLRAKGVLVVPFFMKGKYGQPRKAASQQQHYSQGSNDERPDKKEAETKEMKKKRLINKEKLERLKQYKLKSRNQMGGGDGKGVFNTMSPRAMQGKINPNANLLQKNKTKMSLQPKERKETQKVTLELLQHMNLKELNNHRRDDFKPTDIMGDDENIEMGSSVFNYFFPDQKKKEKGKGKKTTTNKFNLKKAVIKDPMNKIPEEDAQTNYYSEKEKVGVSRKSAKSKLGNVTSRAHNQSKGKNDTRRSMNAGHLTDRRNNKSSAKSKSKSKTKKNSSMTRGRNKSSQKNKILSRAAQIDKQTKMKEKAQLNKVMKMHDNQMKKGLSVANKRKF